MGKIKQLFGYIEEHKDGIDKITPWFLMTYFIFICFPYIFARINVLNNIFTNSTIAFILRFGFLLLYTIYGITIMISHKLKINWVVIIGLLSLFIIFIVSTLVSPDTITCYSFYFTGKISINETTLGTYIKLVHVVRFGGDLIFFFFLFCAYPYSLKSRNQFTYVVIPAVVIATIGVFYSLLFERGNLSTVLNGGNPELVHSIFHSKNAYGIFLFNGAIAITFIFFVDSRRWLKLLGLLIPVFLIMSFIINCKLAAACITLLLILTYAYSVYRYFKRRRYVSFILLGIALAISLGFVLLFTVPAVREIGLLSRIYDKIIDSLSSINISSFIGRTEEWAMVPCMTKGIYRWIGFSTPVGYELIISYTSINGSTSKGVYDLHNAYVDFYAYHGIFGCILLGLLYVYIGYLIYKLYKKDRTMALLVSMIFAVSILFGMAETYRLFLSMSANTFALNFLILGVLLFELKDDETVLRPNISIKKIHNGDKEDLQNA